MVVTMVGMGKFVEYFKKEVTEWQNKLGNVEETLKVWNIVMKAWASLESIFLESADIRNQLPDDTKRFEGIDETFKDLQGACTAERNHSRSARAGSVVSSEATERPAKSDPQQRRIICRTCAVTGHCVA